MDVISTFITILFEEMSETSKQFAHVEPFQAPELKQTIFRE